MKNKILIILTLLLLLTSCKPKYKNVLTAEYYCPEPETIVKTTGANYVNRREAENDLEWFNYYLHHEYAGIIDMYKRGYDFETFRTNVMEKFVGYKITSNEFVDIIYKEIELFIDDGHFLVNSASNFCSKHLYAIWFSNIFIDKETKEVIRSDSEDLVEGQSYDFLEENLFNTVLDGKECYRLGFLSNDNKSFTSDFLIDDKKISLGVNYIGENVYIDEVKFFEDEKIQYIRIPTFFDMTFNEDEEKIIYGDEIKNKEYIIFDLRNNLGGTSDIAQGIFTKLYLPSRYSIKDAFIKSREYYSNDGIIFNGSRYQNIDYESIRYIEKRFGVKSIYNFEDLEFDKDYARLYQIEETGKIKNHDNPDYKGKIIILMNRKTASCSEFFIQNAERLFPGKTVLVGENTYGCAWYGYNWRYTMPNSRLSLYIGLNSNKNIFNLLESFAGETKGFMPDYWTSDRTLLDTLYYITGDEEIYSTLSEITKYN